MFSDGSDGRQKFEVGSATANEVVLTVNPIELKDVLRGGGNEGGDRRLDMRLVRWQGVPGLCFKENFFV